MKLSWLYPTLSLCNQLALIIFTDTAGAAQILIDHQADVNFIDAGGATPLHVAVENGNSS